MKIYRSLALVAAVLSSLAASELSCYYPDGKNATGLIPCKPDAEVSHCCREADVCLTSGMCFSPGLNSLVRRACTDKTWNSTECPNFCIVGTLEAPVIILPPTANTDVFG